jgi:DNA-binding protein HU-beta
MVVHLVHRQQRRLSGIPHGLRDLAIPPDQPFTAIHNEHKEIGLADLPPPALPNELVQWILARAEHAARIGQLEMRTFPFHRLRQDIAGGARQRRHDRSTRSRQAIEEGRLPHVWAADQHDRGQRPGHVCDDVDRLSDYFYSSYSVFSARRPRMIKVDIVNEVSKIADITKVKAEVAVDAVFDAMRLSMQRGDRIELRGFGVFQVKPRKRGIGRNPRTGKEVRIPPGRTIRFKPGKDLQNIG